MAVEVTEVENEAAVNEAGQIVAATEMGMTAAVVLGAGKAMAAQEAEATEMWVPAAVVLGAGKAAAAQKAEATEVQVCRPSPSPFRPGVGGSGVGRVSEGEGEEGVEALLMKMATEVRCPIQDHPTCRPSPARAAARARFPAGYAASWRLGGAGWCPQRFAPDDLAPSADDRPAQAAARPRSPASCAASWHASWQLWSAGAH